MGSLGQSLRVKVHLTIGKAIGCQFTSGAQAVNSFLNCCYFSLRQMSNKHVLSFVHDNGIFFNYQLQNCFRMVLNLLPRPKLYRGEETRLAAQETSLGWTYGELLHVKLMG